MATIVPVMGEQILIKIGNGATPEVFAAPGLINASRAISFTASTETDQLVDLANQSAPAITVRRVTASDFKVDGEGMINKADVTDYLRWSQSGEACTAQITDGKWKIQGPVVLTSFSVTGERLKCSTCQITFEQAGAMVITET